MATRSGTMPGMPLQEPDIYTTQAWAGLLSSHGWAESPLINQPLPVNDVQGGVFGHVHLVCPGRGDPWRSASNYYSAAWGVVPVRALHSPHQLDWSGLVAAIRGLPGASVLQLDPLPVSGAVLFGLQPALRQAGFATDTYFCFGNWYTPLGAFGPGGFAAYWAQRPSTLRHTVDRAMRRLDRAHPGWRLGVTTGANTPEQVEAALAAYQAVYAQSWKEPEPAVRFIPELVRLAAREGWLRLGVLHMGEQPVAAQLWLVHGGTAHIYKLAYVQGFEKLSVGSVLTAHLMRHVIDVDGVQELDYGMGDEPYKQDWMTHRRERVGLVAFDLRQPRAWWPALRHFGGKWVRRLR